MCSNSGLKRPESLVDWLRITGAVTRLGHDRHLPELMLLLMSHCLPECLSLNWGHVTGAILSPSSLGGKSAQQGCQ